MFLDPSFQYRGLSMTELNEMIYWYKAHRTEDVIKENARLRQTLSVILDWITRTRIETMGEGSYASAVDRESVLIDDIEALCAGKKTIEVRVIQR